MPISHIGLTVSHLPASCSFYLAALQPLGYRYIGQQGNQIAFGAKEPDFFICQDSPGIGVGPAHVAFAASSREEVDSFFSAALKAGGHGLHGEPKVRDPDTGYYSAAVIDFDDNAVEVVFRDSPKAMSAVSGTRNSCVIEQAPRPAFERGPLRTLVNNITTTVTSTTSSPAPLRQSDSCESKALVGTILGAAAGAAIAYVIAKEESFKSSYQPVDVVRRTTVHHTIGAPGKAQTPRSVHDHGTVSYISEPSSKHTARPRAIGALESAQSDAQSQPSYHSFKPLAIEPPQSIASDTRSRTSIHSPKPLAIEAPRSIMSATTSKRPNRAVPPAPTFYTVQEPSETPQPEEVALPASSHVTRASRASHASKAPSVRSSTTVKAVRTTHTAARYQLPQSTQTSTYTTDARKVPLPASVKTSIFTQEAQNYPLPPSTHHSHATRYSSRRGEMPSSFSRASRAIRNSEANPLPASTKTSFVSRARSPPRSAVSASTVKPLTRGNIRRAATDNGVDDLDTVVPEDSISQAGSKPKGKHRRHRSEGSRTGASRASRKASSKVSMPRSIGRAFGVTA